MTRTRLVSLGALSLLAAVHAPLAAQSNSRVELAFGYDCGDRFRVRNDGANAVTIEYAVAGSQDKSQLHLNAKQSAQIATAEEGNLELWVNGKVVASEPKGNRPCRGAAQNGSGVTVRPYDADVTAAQPMDSTSSAQSVVVYDRRPYDYYDPFYYPYGYGYYGYGPFFYPSVSIYGRGFIGFGHIGRGPVGRGRGRR